VALECRFLRLRDSVIFAGSRKLILFCRPGWFSVTVLKTGKSRVFPTRLGICEGI
jgi:hypothetical protein